jgi:UDP-GlcNAc:undecaprenyl-phosphate GlcNAc-1-phosphate transferase
MFFLAVCSFVLSFLFTPLIGRLALRRGWVDQPDNDRKRHRIPVPRIGGVPIAIAYVGSFAAFLLVGLHGSLTVEQSFPLVWKALPAAILVFVIGLIDDVVGLKPWIKLLGEALAAAIACRAGILVHGVAGYEVHGFLNVLLTIGWLVACTNAFNLIDGLDGLAAGLGLLASLTTLVAALFHADYGLATATAPLAGALVGFLVFNFNPASIFLGDCGSLWIGFMLGSYAVIWSQKSATMLGMTAPMIALSIPLLDLGLAVARRFLRRQPIFSADHDHIHHRLLSRGLTPRRVTLLLYGSASLAAGFSLLLGSARGLEGVVVAFFCVVVWAGIQYLRYQEFGLAARWFRQHGLRSMVKSHVCLQSYEECLRTAASVDECWEIVRTLAREFRFVNVALRLANRRYTERIGKSTSASWTLHIPVSGRDHLRFSGAFDLSGFPDIVMPLADVLQKVLSRKAVEFCVRSSVMAPNAAKFQAYKRARREFLIRRVISNSEIAGKPAPSPDR